MARQEGIISLSGKVGDLIFSNRKGKRHAKARSTKPMNQTAATKRSSVDFGEASKIGARMRRAFAPLINEYGDTTVISRFTKHILKVFKTIPASSVGQKSLGQGNVGIFRDFQFNAFAKLDLLLLQPEVTLEGSGIKVVLKENSIADLFKWVAAANAVVLQLMVYNLNLNGEDDEVVCVKDLIILLEDEHFRGAKLQIPLNLKGEQVVCVALGMHYLREDNLRIGDRTKRAAAIVYAVRLSEGLEVAFVPDQPVVKPVEKDEGGLEWELG
ncbi:hypothetical protein D9M68_705940 [compost metagenome]